MLCEWYALESVSGSAPRRHQMTSHVFARLAAPVASISLPWRGAAAAEGNGEERSYALTSEAYVVTSANLRRVHLRLVSEYMSFSCRSSEFRWTFAATALTVAWLRYLRLLRLFGLCEGSAPVLRRADHRMHQPLLRHDTSGTGVQCTLDAQVAEHVHVSMLPDVAIVVCFGRD
jgi:hypothetical protein